MTCALLGAGTVRSGETMNLTLDICSRIEQSFFTFHKGPIKEIIFLNFTLLLLIFRFYPFRDQIFLKAFLFMFLSFYFFVY